MYCDLPLLLRCCFCCPLRPGLIVWGYLKLTTGIVLIAIASILLSDVVRTYIRHGDDSLTMLFLIPLSILLILLVIDGIFNFLFLLSAHSKNSKLMKSYLYYNIFLFTISNVAFILVLGYFIINVFLSPSPYVGILLVCLAVGFINAVIQFYLILLIRSEIKKLSHNCYVTFENHAGNPQCFMTVGKLNFTGVVSQPKQDQIGLVIESPYDVVQ